MRMLFGRYPALFLITVSTLLIALAAAAAALSVRYRSQWDLTQNQRQTLSPGSQQVLKQLTGPVTITAFTIQADPKLGDVRKLIAGFIALYQREKADISLRFVDPKQQPKLAQAANIHANGELVVEYGGRRENLSTLNEPALTNTLVRLARSSERQIMQVEGHGEPSLLGIANHDLGEFGQQLSARGLRIAPLNLAMAQGVPRNAAVLVVTSPRTEVMPGEAEKILQHVAAGGNLLWLIDQSPLSGLQPLAETLGLVLTPGTLVDPAAAELGGPQTWAIGAGYGSHPVTDQFNLITAFPFARSISVTENSGWRATPLIDAAPRGWVETDSVAVPTFDAKHDMRGPATIAVALTRQVSERAQRIIVVGNSSFLSNSFLGNGGNLDLGVNMLNWLAGDDRLIAIAPRPTLDASLKLSKHAITGLVIGFLVLLPASLLAVGAWLAWRRR